MLCLFRVYGKRKSRGGSLRDLCYGPDAGSPCVYGKCHLHEAQRDKRVTATVLCPFVLMSHLIGPLAAFSMCSHSTSSHVFLILQQIYAHSQMLTQSHPSSPLPELPPSVWAAFWIFFFFFGLASCTIATPGTGFQAKPWCRGLPVGGVLPAELWCSSSDGMNITEKAEKEMGLAVRRCCVKITERKSSRRRRSTYLFTISDTIFMFTLYFCGIINLFFKNELKVDVT